MHPFSKPLFHPGEHDCPATHIDDGACNWRFPVKIQDKSIIKVVFESNRQFSYRHRKGVPQVNRSILERITSSMSVSTNDCKGAPREPSGAHSTLSHSPGSVIVNRESLPRSIQRTVGWNPIRKFRLRLMMNRPAVSEVRDSSHLLCVGSNPDWSTPSASKSPEKLTRNIQPEVGVERLTRFTKILSGSE